MAYGSIKANTIIFNSGGGDTTVDLTTLLSNGSDFSGGVIEATSFTGVTGVFTTSLSGASITGSTGNVDAITGVNAVFTTEVSGNLYKCSGDVTVISGSGDVRPYGLYSFPTTVGTANYVLKTNGDGTTDWAAFNNPTVFQISGITSDTNAIASTYYVLLSGLTLTLPASPAAGDYVGIINRSNTVTGTIARNGSNIMASGADLTLDDVNARFRLVYANASQGWVIL